MAIRAGVLLSGCGVFDGSEIHEAVSILIALDRKKAEIICIAPNMPQAEVISHRKKAPEPAARNVLEESARIARGKIRDLAEVRAGDLDALFFPGGFGAAKNLSDFAKSGANCKVHPDVTRLMRDVHAAKKPIGLACIAPVLAAKVFGTAGIKTRLTVGTDPGVAGAINSMGGEHCNTGPTDVCIDEANRIVTTPCYMNDVGPWTVFQGAEKMVDVVLKMTGMPIQTS
jgi:enhancing lycopene biosynthesis protein 2